MVFIQNSKKDVIWHQIMDNNEFTILRKLKEGDEEAYIALYKQYYIPLCAYAHRYLGRKDISEEIVSETFFNIWIKRHSLEIRTSLKSYLFQAVCKNSLNYLRKIKKEENLEDYLIKHTTNLSGLASLPNELPVDSLITKDLGVTISQAVDKLPLQQQTAFRLKRYEGKKNKEIAEIMGISIKTVEMHISKALQTLRLQLKEYLTAALFALIAENNMTNFWS
jgi:RNA polymerase sigma-70 factor, ECF subfamily